MDGWKVNLNLIIRCEICGSSPPQDSCKLSKPAGDDPRGPYPSIETSRGSYLSMETSGASYPAVETTQRPCSAEENSPGFHPSVDTPQEASQPEPTSDSTKDTSQSEITDLANRTDDLTLGSDPDSNSDRLRTIIDLPQLRSRFPNVKYYHIEEDPVLR